MVLFVIIYFSKPLLLWVCFTHAYFMSSLELVLIHTDFSRFLFPTLLSLGFSSHSPSGVPFPSSFCHKSGYASEFHPHTTNSHAALWTEDVQRESFERTKRTKLTSISFYSLDHRILLFQSLWPERWVISWGLRCLCYSGLTLHQGREKRKNSSDILSHSLVFRGCFS